METIQVGKLLFKIRDQRDKEILETEILLDRYRLPKQMKTAIDIGAHIGGTAIFAAQRGAMVYAYEPNKENFDLLVENVKLNHFENRIKCFNQAVAGDKGKVRLYLDPKDSAAHNLYSKSDKFEEVEAVRFDNILFQHGLEQVDFVKMDCEEAEWEIIVRTPQSYLYKVDYFSIEMHRDNLPQWKKDEVIRWIGYKWDCYEKLYYYFHKK